MHFNEKHVFDEELPFNMENEAEEDVIDGGEAGNDNYEDFLKELEEIKNKNFEPDNDLEGGGVDDELLQELQKSGAGAAKRMVRRAQQPKLDFVRLAGPHGLPRLVEMFSHTKFSNQPDEEIANLETLLFTYQKWCHEIMPNTKFSECVAKFAHISTRRDVQTLLQKIRMDMIDPGGVTAEAEVEEEAAANQEREQEIYPDDGEHRNHAEQQTPEEESQQPNEEVNCESQLQNSWMALTSPLHIQSQSSTQSQQSAAVIDQSSPVASKPLTDDEIRQRIEENHRKARERLSQSRKSGAAFSSPSGSNFLSQVFKQKQQEKQHQEERRQFSVDQSSQSQV